MAILLTQRLRRLRQNPILREMVREHTLSPHDFVMPYFVRQGKKVRKPIASMPGQFQFSIDTLVKEAKELKKIGIQAVILFGIPDGKDSQALGAYSPNGVIQQAVKVLKDAMPDILVITDVCLCEYMDHGHCGVVSRMGSRFTIENDKTLALLEKVALSHAKAGADIVAPSGMMDGAVAAIRRTLDETGYVDVPIMAYAAKFASAFYNPFREAAESPPQFGDRRTYQMDISNSDEALREIELDIREGADIIMVKPALAYLDILRRAKECFHYPTAAFNVSGEYAMIKAASQKGWLEEKKVVPETLMAIKRAGADIILTYWAKEAARWIR